MKLDQELAVADAAFGTDLYARLAGPGSLVFSPASIAAALRMALIGARGETATEMAAVLHLPGPADARDAQQWLTDHLREARQAGLTLTAVNTAWLDRALNVRPEFLDQPVTVRRADFRNAAEAARQAINAAVKEQTAGKITDLIQPGMVSLATRLVLVNAIYLNARWEHQFPAGNTRKAPFYPEGTGPSHVDMMHLDARLAYHEGDGFQSVLLPYEAGPVAMAIVAPRESLAAFTGRLPALGGLAGVLRGLLDGPEQCDVDLRLPKFKVTAGFLLRDTLSALGMSRAFSEAADFSGISTDEQLWIDEAIHKAYIDVNEEGTEAAAATAVVMRALGMFRPAPARRVVLTADHPFLFAVLDTRSGLPLFLGQFTRPS
jgi:serpin B